MTNHPASWRMPTRAQTERWAHALPDVGEQPTSASSGPGDPMPVEWWDAVLSDPQVGAKPRGSADRLQRLDQIARHLLRVECRRCGRTVEIQKADAVRLYGPQALWKTVAQPLLDATCQERTGRLEEDGCWPSVG
ncbi:hypothetical protein QDT69_28515 [Bradyrhizobium sp. CER78]|nr:hypothetical protein [Bradyrhizobium sp. CER78]MDH2385479.1 hypothetical protein [Bradyrhizobium sp. CER78]